MKSKNRIKQIKEGRQKNGKWIAFILHLQSQNYKIEVIYIFINTSDEQVRTSKIMESFERENLWRYDSEFDNVDLLNKLSTTVLFQPLINYEQIRPNTSDTQINFMDAFAGGKECKNSLRLLSTQYIAPTQKVQAQNTLYFCLPSKNERNNQKRFSLLPYYNLNKKGEHRMLSLDEPKKVLIINGTMLVAIQKKSITLYHIHDQHLMLKDFDSIGIGNKLVLAELSHVNYKGKDYILVFGNQKEDIKPFFKCLVYEVASEKLKFIKKANIFQRETYKPIILFDNYHNSAFEEEKFCLVVGGFSTYQQQNYNFGALQIHLHLLLDEWIDYPMFLTNQIHFNQKHTITSGKALKISTKIVTDECWLLFCTEYQTLTKLYLHFGQQNDDKFLLKQLELETKTLSIRDQRIGQIEPLLYIQNSLYLMHVPEAYQQSKDQIPYRIYWCDKTMQRVRSRPLRQLLTLFIAK